MYQTVLSTFSQIKLDILTGLKNMLWFNFTSGSIFFKPIFFSKLFFFNARAKQQFL